METTVPGGRECLGAPGRHRVLWGANFRGNPLREAPALSRRERQATSCGGRADGYSSSTSRSVLRCRPSHRAGAKLELDDRLALELMLPAEPTLETAACVIRKIADERFGLSFEAIDSGARLPPRCLLEPSPSRPGNALASATKAVPT
jgi:hypothetical protein